jgi:hypothetical protein
MPQLLIDVENSSGVKQGDGPIISSTGWQQIRAMDRLGSFSFTMSASDPRAALLVSRAVVRARYDNEEVGSGIVDSVELDVQSDAPMLKVSGNDLGQELTWWDVGHLPLNKSANVRPIGVYYQWVLSSSGAKDGAETDQPNAYDGNAGTHFDYNTPGAQDSRPMIYVGSVEAFAYLDFTIGSSSSWAGGSGRWQYFNGTGWADLAPTSDTTKIGSAYNETLTKSGRVTWGTKSDWVTINQFGLNGWWIRFEAGWATAREIIEITALGHVPTETSLALLTALWTSNAYGPDWDLDATAGFTTTAKSDVYGLVEWENHIAALNKIATLTGEHWYIGVGRKVVWARNLADFADCGLRAIVPADPIAAEPSTDVCFITKLTRTRETFDRCAAIYPYGAGLGDGKLDLTNVTKTPASGYALMTVGGFQMVKHTATYATLAGWRGVSMKDIGPSTTDQRAREYAANQLLDAAIAWLERHRGENYAYSLEVVHLPKVIYPCQTIRVVYHRWVDGYHAVNVDADLVVLSSTTQIDASGIQTVALTVSTIDAWPLSDTEVLARMAKQAAAMGVYPQPSELRMVNSQTFAANGSILTVGGGGLTGLRTG